MMMVSPKEIRGLSKESYLREWRAKRLAVEAVLAQGQPIRIHGAPSDVLRGYIEYFSTQLLLEEIRKDSVL